MALSDYNPVLQWYADGLTDLNEPTGTTKSNPGALGDPTIAGSGDQYALFAGSEAVSFLPSPTVLGVGTGDLTIIVRARIDTFNLNDVLWENYDGAGGTNDYGLRLYVSSESLRRVALQVPPRSSSFSLDTPNSVLVAGQDLIVAMKRTSGTWAMWLSADGTTAMSAATPYVNAIGTSVITSVGDLTFGAQRDGTAPFTAGRIYWLVAFDEAIDDADLGLSSWTDEANLKSTWAGGGGFVAAWARGSNVLLG